MKQLLILLCLMCVASLYAQKDTKELFYVHRYLLDSAARNLDSSFVAFKIFNSHKKANTGTPYVDVVFFNNSSEETTIVWWSFESTNGVPLNANCTAIRTDVMDPTENSINFHPNQYMDPGVYAHYKKATYHLVLAPYEVLVRSIQPWWPRVYNGLYDFHIKFYDHDSKRTFVSNTISLDCGPPINSKR